MVLATIPGGRTAAAAAEINGVAHAAQEGEGRRGRLGPNRGLLGCVDSMDAGMDVSMAEWMGRGMGHVHTSGGGVRGGEGGGVRKGFMAGCTDGGSIDRLIDQSISMDGIDGRVGPCPPTPPGHPAPLLCGVCAGSPT